MFCVGGALYPGRDRNVLCQRNLCPGKGWNVLCREELCVPKKLEIFCSSGTLCPERAGMFRTWRNSVSQKNLKFFRSWETLCTKRAWNVLYLEELCVLKKLDMFCTWRNSVSWKSLEWSVTEECCVPKKPEFSVPGRTLCPKKAWNVLYLKELWKSLKCFARSWESLEFSVLEEIRVPEEL